MKIFILFFFILCGFFANAKEIAIISDSIGSIRRGPSFPVLIEKRHQGSIRVINNYQGATTTETAYSRLEAILKEQTPDILIITLGINDALSFQRPINDVYKDFEKTINLAHVYGIPVIVGRIQLTAYHHIIKDIHYEISFEMMYDRLSKDLGVTLFPFLYKEFIFDSSNTFDGIHPTLKGQEIITNNLDEVLKKFL